MWRLRSLSSWTRRPVVLQARPQRSLSTTAATTEDSVVSATPQLYMWGTDTQGCLLRPPELKSVSRIDVPTAVDNTTTVGDEKTIQHICCGATDTALVYTDGTCQVWGENKHGQLGVGHTQVVDQPTWVTLPSADAGIASVALGPQTAAFVDTAGDLYTCGSTGSVLQGFGLLGQGYHENDNADDDTTTPQLVTSLIEDGAYVQQVTVGEAHLTVLTTEGEVLCTGAGSYGRLGNFDTVDQLYLEPVEILTPKDRVTAIAGGKSFTLALTADGVVYGWGRNHKGQLGTGFGMAVDMYAMQAIPEPIEADELVGRKVIQIAAGAGHAACITEGGELFYWGMSVYLEPYRVTELLHTKIVDVQCGLDYTLAIDEEGRMYSFGKGSTGVLGQGSVKNLNQPQLMEAFSDKKVLQASAGWKHAACLVTDA